MWTRTTAWARKRSRTGTESDLGQSLDLDQERNPGSEWIGSGSDDPDPQHGVDPH